MNHPLFLTDDDTGYNLTRSVRSRSSASAYWSRTNKSTVTSNNIWTWCGWRKLGTLTNSNAIILYGTGSPGTADECSIKFSNNQLEVINYVGSTVQARRITNAVKRDPAHWYQICVSSNGASGLSIEFNGLLETSFATSVGPGAAAWALNTASVAVRMGAPLGGTFQYFDGLQAEDVFVDGQALSALNFGEFDSITGVWKPKRYTGTYGLNGGYWPYTDNSALTTSSNVGLGKDFSGNGNYWTTNNISLTSGVTYDSMTDVPTLTSATAANFCVINPLDKDPSVTVSEGNLAHSTGASWLCSRGSFQIPTAGKWYWETTIGTTTSASVGASVGLCTAAAVLNNFNTTGQYAVQAAATGNIYVNGTNQASGLGTFAAGDIIQVAADCTNGKIWVGKNNVFWNSAGGTTGNPSGNTNETINVTPVGMFPFTATYQDTVRYNFGQRPFSYTPPTGFVSLNTFNLQAGTVTSSGSFVGNASTAGPSVYLNGVPTAMTINGNAVTFGTHADKTAYGFKIRSSSASYNSTGTNTYSVTTVGAVFKYANAQGNP